MNLCCRQCDAKHPFLDLPSNIALRYMSPRVFITLTAFAWGVVIMCSGFVKSWKSLVVLRVLLGAFEAGERLKASSR